MIQALSETCSVKWTEINHKVYKFQALLFKNDIAESEMSVSSEDRTASQPSQVISQNSECPNHSKMTSPIQWKELYSEYLGKTHEVTHSRPASPASEPPTSPFISRQKNIANNCEPSNKEKRRQKRVHFEDEVKFDNEVKFDSDDDEVF